MVWAGFSLSLVVLVALARWNLWLAMGTATTVLGLITLSPAELGRALLNVLADPSIMLLALVVTLIPLIGSVLERTGRMESLVENLRIGRRAFVGAAPAILGMLPMPGGALLSSPLLERAGGAPGPLRAAANVWFRHVLLLVYPISSSLIASTKLAGLDVWAVIPYQVPALLLAAALGYAFLLRSVRGGMNYRGAFSWPGLLVPLGIILAAPAVDLVVKEAAALPVPELATLAGVLLSLGLASWGRIAWTAWPRLVTGLRPWRFGLIVVGMFSYLEVFQVSGAPGLIASLPLSPQALGVGVGALLGLATGRIQAPASIIIPIYVSQAGGITPWAFAIIYFSVWLGYIVSPVHPCLPVSVEYSGTALGPTVRALLPPTLVALAATLLASFWML
ncbi:MAG: DUF401 family protein [Candidatus Bipolaricaulaceae bacterium]